MEQFERLDKTRPTGSWEFNDGVTEVFDNMLERSIPQYRVMRELVTDVGAHFVRPGTSIVDLGCSRGGSLAPFVPRFEDRVKYVGVEVSPPMLAAARARFRDMIEKRQAYIERMDITEDFPYVQASLYLSVFTLQFVPLEKRRDVVNNIHKNLIPGGAFILVEKIEGATPQIRDLMIDKYHSMKHANGYTKEEIEAKRKSLEGVLVPRAAKMNEQMLWEAGFRKTDCFWRWMNFAGWVAIKE